MSIQPRLADAASAGQPARPRFDRQPNSRDRHARPTNIAMPMASGATPDGTIGAHPHPDDLGGCEPVVADDADDADDAEERLP